MTFSYRYIALSASEEVSFTGGYIVFNTTTNEEADICFDSEEEARLACHELNILERNSQPESTA